jgi:hypothetical protein
MQHKEYYFKSIIFHVEYELSSDERDALITSISNFVFDFISNYNNKYSIQELLNFTSYQYMNISEKSDKAILLAKMIIKKKMITSIADAITEYLDSISFERYSISDRLNLLKKLNINQISKLSKLNFEDKYFIRYIKYSSSKKLTFLL